MIARPGNSTIQNAWCAYCWLPAIIVPQVGISGGTPTPRNDSAGLGQDRVGEDERRLHQDRRHQVRQDVSAEDAAACDTPSARAASTKSSSRTTSVEARTTRATRGV